MLTYTQGNLLKAETEALVNTVNTVGVMGKGIALMFKETFPENFKSYAAACRRKEVRVGEMFVTEGPGLTGPRWIINFPTKMHWRNPTRIEWVRDGLQDLRRVILERNIRSLAVPPLGCGNGGLAWNRVRPLIEQALGDLPNTDIVVYEPTKRYQNVAKREGVQKLTPARALIAELIRRYWFMGIDCSLLEVQKLAWFLEREMVTQNLDSLDLRFVAHRYGPYSERLRHSLEALDGSYLRSEIRIADAKPTDLIFFNAAQKEKIKVYLSSETSRDYARVLEAVTDRIDGFESPFGLELLATVDWLLHKEGRRPELDDIKKGLAEWPGGKDSGDRKLRIFDDRSLQIALKRLKPPS